MTDEPRSPLAHDVHEPAGPHSFWTGRSGLVIPAVLFALGVFLVYGNSVMDVADDGELFGPKAFPWIAAIACFVVGVLLTIQILRSPDVPESMIEEDGTLRAGTASNWPAVAITVGSFVGFALILETVGWIISAALVFWGITIGLGNRRYLFNLLIGLAMSSIMQLVFSGMLGLSLPPGVMGG